VRQAQPRARHPRFSVLRSSATFTSTAK
jgi:hypothetical protein